MLTNAMRNLHAPIYRKRISVLSNLIVPYLRSGDKVLDIGCGSGLLGQAVLTHEKCPVGVSYTGAEKFKRGDEPIDVRRLIASTTIEELNRRAEEYFAGLETWEHHLAKPFAASADSPQLLISLGALLHGLQLDIQALQRQADAGPTQRKGLRFLAARKPLMHKHHLEERRSTRIPYRRESLDEQLEGILVVLDRS